MYGLGLVAPAEIIDAMVPSLKKTEVSFVVGRCWAVWWDSGRLHPAREWNGELGTTMRWGNPRGKESEEARGKNKLQVYEDWLRKEDMGFELQERRD